MALEVIAQKCVGKILRRKLRITQDSPLSYFSRFACSIFLTAIPYQTLLISSLTPGSETKFHTHKRALSMQSNHPWEPGSCQRQHNSYLAWNPKVNCWFPIYLSISMELRPIPEATFQHVIERHCRIHRSFPLFHVLSQTNPVNNPFPHSISPRFILILSTHLRLGLPSGLFFFAFPPIAYTLSSFLQFVLLPRPSHSHILDHCNYI
jgi:hypothetical protein